jgi:hypothetical protein
MTSDILPVWSAAWPAASTEVHSSSIRLSGGSTLSSSAFLSQATSAALCCRASATELSTSSVQAAERAGEAEAEALALALALAEAEACAAAAASACAAFHRAALALPRAWPF